MDNMAESVSGIIKEPIEVLDDDEELEISDGNKNIKAESIYL